VAAADPAAFPVLAAAPGMTARDIERASTIDFKLPADDNERGVIQPPDPCRVQIVHPEHGFEVPPGRFTIVDCDRGRAWRITATPCLEYLGLDDTIELVRTIAEAVEKARWEWLQSPDYDVLPAELPKREGESMLGEWKLGDWVCELSVYQALEVGSDEARIANMPGGGWLTTVIVWDPTLRR
jgi:hypothetical protein